MTATSLEEHIAYHAQAIDEISREMAEQWKAIRRVEAKLDRIVEHLKAMQEEAGDSPPPPHY